MDDPYDSLSSEPITTKGLKDPWDPLVNEEIILIGEMIIVGGWEGEVIFPSTKSIRTSQHQHSCETLWYHHQKAN